MRYSAGAVQRKPRGPIILLHLPEQGGVVGSDDDWELGGNGDDLEEWSDTTSNAAKKHDVGDELLSEGSVPVHWERLSAGGGQGGGTNECANGQEKPRYGSEFTPFLIPQGNIIKTAAWKHEHEFVNTTTRWDNYPLQVIN
jgi:hypothetical protein